MLKENSGAHDHALIHTPHDMLPSAEPTSSLYTRLLPDHIVPPPGDAYNQGTPFSTNSSSTGHSPGQPGANFAQTGWPGAPHENVDPMLNWEMIALGMEEPLPSQDIMDALYAHCAEICFVLSGGKGGRGLGTVTAAAPSFLALLLFLSRRMFCADSFCLIRKDTPFTSIKFIRPHRLSTNLAISRV